MQDSLNLEKIAGRVEKHQQRERRALWLSLAILLVVMILLLVDMSVLAPMVRQFEQAIDRNPENLAVLLQQQAIEMASLAVELASVLILIGLLQWRSKRPKRRQEYVRKILLHLLPDLEYNPQTVEFSPRTWVTWLTVAVVVADVVIVFLSWSLWLVLVMPVCIFVTGWLWQTYVIPHIEAETEEEREYQRVVFVHQVMVVGFTTAAIGVGLAVLYPWLVDRGIRSLIALVLAAMVGIGSVYGLFYAFAIAPYLTIRTGPLARGDYDGALTMWRRWGRLVPILGTEPLIGFALLLAGRQEEAKTIWWGLLLQVFAQGLPIHVALRLINFASALESPEYDSELIGLFAGAVRIAPESPVSYRTLAAYYLFTGVYPERALAVTDMMMRYAQPPGNNLLLQRYDWSLTLGVRALALASTGRHEESNTIMGRAFAETDPQFQPGMAWLHTNAGRIKQIQQDASAATEHFTQAIKLDPNGASGAWAQTELDGQ